MRGKVDVAFLRRETQAPGLAFKFLIKEPLAAVLPTGHRLAKRKDIRLADLAGEIYITPTRVAPALKVAIENYAAKSGVTLKPAYDAENLSSVMSLVATTGGVTLLPLYVRNLLSPSVVIRPLQGEAPTIDLVIGYNRSSTVAAAQTVPIPNRGTGLASSAASDLRIPAAAIRCGSRKLAA